MKNRLPKGTKFYFGEHLCEIIGVDVTQPNIKKCKFLKSGLIDSFIWEFKNDDGKGVHYNKNVTFIKRGTKK